MNLNDGECKVEECVPDVFSCEPFPPAQKIKYDECRLTEEPRITKLTEPAVNEHSSQTVVPQLLDYQADDISSQSNEFFAGEDFAPSDEINAALAAKSQNSHAFITNEDSIALTDEQFDHFTHIMDNSTVSSSCFSRNSLLVCDESQDSVPKEIDSTFGGLLTHVHDSYCEQAEDVDADTLVAVAEDSSMDSGLGSVESAYANSEEDSAASPENYAISLSEAQDMDGQSIEERYESPEKFYDCVAVVSEGLKPSNAKKRGHCHEDWEDYEQTAAKKTKNDKKVSFCDVTVYYFPRRQSFVTVPSQGGSTLGMDIRHIHCQTMTLQEHKEEVKRKHKLLIKQHMKERKLESKIKQLKFMNPELDSATLSSIASKEISSDEQKSDESDNDDSLLDKVDDFFFLQPIPAKKRRELLRLAGVERIDGEEKLMNRMMRESRERCGCSCDGVCHSDTCECALSGIQCQVDRDSFPCSCALSGCQNEHGRVEFDSERVRYHTEATMERLRLLQEGLEDDAPVIEEKETESVSSIDSECELASSDDADQSETDPGEQNVTADLSAFSTACVQHEPLYALNMHSSAQRKCAVENVLETSVSPAVCTMNRADDRTAAINSGFCGQEKDIPSEFLESLNLQKIEFNAFFPPHLSTESYPTGVRECIVGFQTGNNTLCKGWGRIGHAGTSTETIFAHRPTLTHKRSNSLDYFVSDLARGSQSMFGTTSSKTNCRAKTLSRDCAVLLDPIATFMTSTYCVNPPDAV